VIDVDRLELFILKSAALRVAVEAAMPISRMTKASVSSGDEQVKASVAQFSKELRDDAEAMSHFYKLFYMLENDIRKLIDETLTEAFGSDWWDEHVPTIVKDECAANQKREAEYGVTSRSDNNLDYISFGQLGDIIRANYALFGGMISNQKAMGRVMSALNNLRGPIAHCGILADDEIDRLKLTVKDWFRLLEGPKS
jgi:hypothetical protein